MTGRLSVPPTFSGHTRRWGTASLIAIGLIVLAGWGLLGGRVIDAINPSLLREIVLDSHPALDVWITPPEMASDTQPMIISTPAGLRFEHDMIIVPQGSVLSAHLGEQDGDAPEVIIDGKSQTFTEDEHGDFATTLPLTEGKKLSIHRGWSTLASWRIKVVADDPPKVTLNEPFTVTDSKTLRVAYSASDAIGVKKMVLRVTPNDIISGSSNKSFEVPLPLPTANQMAHVELGDLTSHPWAGRNVSLQIIATNEAGKQGLSTPSDVTLPSRDFINPVARLLIEERTKLLQHPESETLREEAANMMAGIAYSPSNYHADHIVLMALRSGAVRLVLQNDVDSAIAANDILWKSASRIEAGNTNIAEQMLHNAPQNLTKDP